MRVEKFTVAAAPGEGESKVAPQPPILNVSDPRLDDKEDP